MRCRFAAGAMGLGCAGLLVATMVAPAQAYGGPGGCAGPAPRQCGPGGPAGPPDMARDCDQAGMGGPAAGDLRVAADVADGATVRPGQDIGVKLTWDPNAWSGPDLDAALACVRVKGGLDPDLSGGERPSANDGAFEFVLHVPENIRPGCDLCIQGLLEGMTDGGPQQAATDGPCFMSGPPGPPSPPDTRPPTPPVTQPPPAGPTTTTTAPRTPTEVGGVQAGRPGTELTPAPEPAGPAVAPAGELPRTGAPLADLALASSGLTLTFGGLSIIGGAGRRRTRRRR